MIAARFAKALVMYRMEITQESQKHEKSERNRQSSYSVVNVSFFSVPRPSPLTGLEQEWLQHSQGQMHDQQTTEKEGRQKNPGVSSGILSFFILRERVRSAGS